MLIEPDTTFIVKDIVKESPERTRIVVEVQERDVPVLNDAVKRFISNKPAETPQQTAITTAETTQNTKTATTKTLAVMRACYKEVFCPNVLTEEEFDAVTPFTTQSLLQKVFSSKAAQSIGFPGFLSRIFLGSSKLYRKHARLLQQQQHKEEEEEEVDEDEEGTTETFCGEKTFVRDMLYIAIKAHNIVYSANRVELRVDVAGAGLKTEKNAMCWAKHVSQQLTAGLPHGTFAYNGACTYKGFSGNSFWMTMYAKTATNTQAVTPPPPSPETAAATTTTIKTVVDAVNGFQGNKFCVYAKEFSLVLLGFSVPNVEPFSKYDVCPSVSKAITAAFHILADSVSYAPSAVPAGKNVVVALSSRDDADAILRNSSITLAGQRCKITECPTVRVPASPDVFCGEFGPSVYFLALSRDDRNGLVCGTVFDEVACSRLVAKVPSAVVVDDDDAVIPGQEEEEVAEKEKESQKSRPTSPWKTGVLPKSVPSQHAYLVSNKKI